MWDGPGHGLRGGPAFRGDHRGERFGGRDRSMHDFRPRDQMNMGPFGHMGSRTQDFPPMDMRRMDGPPMRGCDMDTRDMRGREPNRDFFRSAEEQNLNFRRQYDGPFRENVTNLQGFPGPGRNQPDMGARGMPQREHDRFMDMRDRDSPHFDMSRLNNPTNEGRRGFPMERLDRGDEFRERRDRPPLGGTSPFGMDMPPHERTTLDSDRRGRPNFSQRGGFNSDMDFRNRPGPSPDFRSRERSPLRFGPPGFPPKDGTQSDVHPDRSGSGQSREGEYPVPSESPLMDYRSGEEMTLAEEWKNRQKDKKSFSNKDTRSAPEPRFPGYFARDSGRASPPFSKTGPPPVEFVRKDDGFPLSDHFASVDQPPVGNNAPQDHQLPTVKPNVGSLGMESKNTFWHGQDDQNLVFNRSCHDGFPLEKSQALNESQNPIEDLKRHNAGPVRCSVEEGSDFPNSGALQGKDQDYRDIDYRTGSGRIFDYKNEELHAPETLIKDAEPVASSKFSGPTSQDQDYRSASLEDKVSRAISIMGIPKSATMEQILNAFADHDGVLMRGMKIKNVVPGYSYDTAYVEFLKLEDAVHFMESNKGSLKVGTKSVSMKYVHSEEHKSRAHESDPKPAHLQDASLPISDQPSEELNTSNQNGYNSKGPVDPQSQTPLQRSSDLTPEAWQQQVDQRLQQQEKDSYPESWSNHHLPPPLPGAHHTSHQSDTIFKDSKTMIIKNVKPTTTVETFLKALDPFAYLDERNVRLVKAKPPSTKCFCFVDMDSHEQVTRLVELLTKPKPLYIDGVRVYAEVAKPLKNRDFRRDFDKPGSSIMGYPADANVSQPAQHQHPPPFAHPPPFMPPTHLPMFPPPAVHGDRTAAAINPAVLSDPSCAQGRGYGQTPATDPSVQAGGAGVPRDSGGVAAAPDAAQTFSYGTDTPDVSGYLYDATSGFYYDPETTLYYDPNSRYFYNAQNQEYLYWDAASKTYIPVPSGSSESQTVTMTAEDQAILSNPAANAPLELKKATEAPHTTTAPATPAPAASSNPDPFESAPPTSEKKDEDEESVRKEKDGKEEKPKSLAAVKIMKDMERWAKIQNRQKDSVRSPSLMRSGSDEDRRQSKSADVGFAVFERKNSGGEDLFKKPLAPIKTKDEKSKRPMGSLGLLASDYAAGSDEEVEEDKEDAGKTSQVKRSDEKEDKLTDWKKMACLLCRRQFPNKDALIRHQQLSDLHKQNMEIHLKIKRSKKELEALENQEKKVMSSKSGKESGKLPESKRKKQQQQQQQPQQQQQQQQQQHSSWPSSSRDDASLSERPGLGAEPAQKKKKKEPVVWEGYASYKQAVRKAMFARFKELE